MIIVKQMNYNSQDLKETIAQSIISRSVRRINKITPKYLIHKSLVIQDGNARQGSSSSKTRSEVRGGGKKPWKQKGTGHARSGSSNSPLWNGGGVAFGPKNKTYRKKVNIKEKQTTLITVLYHLSNRLFILKDNYNYSMISAPSTKNFVSFLNNIDGVSLNKRTLIIIDENNKNLVLSFRNIPNVTFAYTSTLNTRDLLFVEQILVTEKLLSYIIT